MNHTAYLTPQDFMFQISNQSVKSFNLEVGEHRDIECKNYFIFTLSMRSLGESIGIGLAASSTSKGP